MTINGDTFLATNCVQGPFLHNIMIFVFLKYFHLCLNIHINRIFQIVQRHQTEFTSRNFIYWVGQSLNRFYRIMKSRDILLKLKVCLSSNFLFSCCNSSPILKQYNLEIQTLSLKTNFITLYVDIPNPPTLPLINPSCLCSFFPNCPLVNAVHFIQT